MLLNNIERLRCLLIGIKVISQIANKKSKERVKIDLELLDFKYFESKIVVPAKTSRTLMRPKRNELENVFRIYPAFAWFLPSVCCLFFKGLNLLYLHSVSHIRCRFLMFL